MSNIVELLLFQDIRSKDSKYPVRVKFVNKTQKKLKLFWVDNKGKFKKAGKIKEGRIEVIDSFEGHKFVADTKKGSPTVINGNMMYIVHATPGSSGEVKAEITTGPSKKNFTLVTFIIFYFSFDNTIPTTLYPGPISAL